MMDFLDSKDPDLESAIHNAENRVFHLLHSLEWQLHSEKKTGSIWSMRCNVMDNQIFRYEGRIPNRSCDEICAMIHPEGLHRAKWDSQSAGTSLIENINSETSIILHKTKSRMMGLISARETVDLCRFTTEEDGTRTVVMVSVENNRVQKNAGVIRALTYPTLLIISPLGVNDSKITAILQAEMFLQGIPKTIVDTFMPKCIATFFEDLMKYAADNDTKVSLNHNLTGWCNSKIDS